MNKISSVPDEICYKCPHYYGYDCRAFCMPSSDEEYKQRVGKEPPCSGGEMMKGIKNEISLIVKECRILASKEIYSKSILVEVQKRLHDIYLMLLSTQWKEEPKK